MESNKGKDQKMFEKKELDFAQKDNKNPKLTP
jgi:hypothetical protein